MYSKGECKSRLCRRVSLPLEGYVNVLNECEAALKEAINIGAVSAVTDSSSRDFQFYSKGIFDGICGIRPDHAVTVVGYATDRTTGVNYWIIKNTWGLYWGEVGYMKLIRNSSHENAPKEGVCGIMMDSSYPVLL
eukprot:GHVR01096251.1.p1 GENE.GHVR01096251.1~~GHVR01096251.1.p1  ORF type:complete len:135 (-),score=30.05 GHVR01096251.1:66-470(-)